MGLSVALAEGKVGGQPWPAVSQQKGLLFMFTYALNSLQHHTVVENSYLCNINNGILQNFSFKYKYWGLNELLIIYMEANLHSVY